MASQIPEAHHVAENTFYVGCVDYNIRSFHGYETQFGTSYNAYAIVNVPHPTIIDSVKYPFAEEYIENIKKAIDLSEIKYAISLHSEPDHSSSFPHLLRAAPHITLYCSRNGKKALEANYPEDFPNWNVVTYKDKDTLDLGDGHVLHFRLVPLLHWPDSSYCFDVKTKTLFSSDAFGQHRAHTARVDDAPGALDWSYISRDTRAYWANILMPFGRQACKALDSLATLPAGPSLVACAHGINTRKYLGEHIELYKRWANHICVRPEVVILYDSMWKATEKVAEAIKEGVMLEGAEATIVNARETHITLIADHVLDAPCLAIGSSHLNGELLPPMGQALTYLKGLQPNWKRVGAAFGSYGWQSHAKKLNDSLVDSGVQSVVDPLVWAYKYTPEVLEKAREMGRELGRHAHSRVAADLEKLKSL
ncbi:hypothetical protein GEMRC1_002430 [Eukaryota sp. GEM-RC1]